MWVSHGESVCGGLCGTVRLMTFAPQSDLLDRKSGQSLWKIKGWRAHYWLFTVSLSDCNDTEGSVIPFKSLPQSSSLSPRQK